MRYQSTGKVGESGHYNVDGIFGANSIGCDTKIWFAYSDDRPGVSLALRGASGINYYYPSYDAYSAATHHVKAETDGTVWYNGENLGMLSDFTTATKTGSITLFTVCSGSVSPSQVSFNRLSHPHPSVKNFFHVVQRSALASCPIAALRLSFSSSVCFSDMCYLITVQVNCQ